MIRAWRIVKTRYSADAFSGEGARLYGGRWNSPGVAMVYTAGSKSLATLEVLVHLDMISRGSSVVLRVPSAVTEGEYNYLLNPAHVDFKKLIIGRMEAFKLDPRLIS